MRSSLALATHTIFFSSFAIGSVICTYLLLVHPEMLAGKTVVVAFCMLAILVFGSWPIYGGECPFTVWEHNAMKREGKRPYKDPCFHHYVKKWFGISTSRHIGSIMLGVFFLTPFLVALWRW